jgi:hypothetical protein
MEEMKRERKEMMDSQDMCGERERKREKRERESWDVIDTAPF